MRTGNPVVVTSLTTATSMTTAEPGGDFKMTTSPQPVRTFERGSWHTLNATLRRNSDGTWSPIVSTSPLRISGGGSGPLATMTSGDKGLSLYWPRPLPAPHVSGTAATYTVATGISLEVSVTDQGGFRDVLVVADQNAASNPMLTHLTMTTRSTGGLRLVAGVDGTLNATAGSSGRAVFTAPKPFMWDSAKTAPLPNRRTAAAAGPSALTALPGGTLTSTATAPGRRAHTAWIATKIGKAHIAATRTAWSAAQTLTLTPPSSLLTGTGTAFPLYLDPSWFHSGGTRAKWASVSDGYPDSNYYDSTPDPAPDRYLQVGFDDVYNARTFIQMNLDPTQLKGAVINSATLQMTEETSWSCTANPRPTVVDRRDHRSDLVEQSAGLAATDRVGDRRTRR
jgi:hypothetical protein